MKYLGIILLFILLLNCGNNGHTVNNNTQFSPIIVKWAPNLHLQVCVRPISRKEIYADLTYKNESDDTILLYKPLFPFNNLIAEDIFSISENESFEMIKYVGSRNEKYLKLAPDDDQGAIIPDTSREKFKIFLPGDSLKFSVNIAQVYDFSMSTPKEDYAFVPSILLPAVSVDYKQIYEKDSLDNKEKPVYYIVTLPRKKDLDSMRVHFAIPGIANP